MAGVYALLRSDGRVLYTSQKAGDWVIASKPDIGANGRNVAVFVPGTDVLSLTTAIPARSDNEARRAAPFAIEDDLAETVDDVHVVLSGQHASDDPKRDVLVVNKVLLQNWLDHLASIGLGDAQVVTAHSVLPDGDHLVETGGTILGRLDNRSFEIERAVGTDVFIGLAASARDLRVHGEALAHDLNTVPSGPALQSDEALLIQLAEWATTKPPLNLRQGAYEARNQLDLQGLSQWAAAATMLLIAGVFWLAIAGFEANAAKRLNADLQDRGRAITNAVWPEANGDMGRALEIARLSPTGSQSFPPALNMTSSVYNALEATPGSELRSLRYDRSRGQMLVIIAFNGFGDVDTFAGVLEAANLSVRPGDARQNGAKVVSEISIGAGS